jgi:DNA-binding NarL/FixJ family response regulator
VVARVLIVDPEPFFCESLATALSRVPEVEVIGWTTDELDAVRVAQEARPEVLFTEVLLAGGSGLSLARKCINGPRVVVLTRGHEGDILLDAVAAGAVGCLSHDVGVSRLAALTSRAAAGDFVVDDQRLHESLRRAAAARTREAGPSAAVARLTAREREVLQLLARGLDNEGIGRALHLSPHTARTHVGNILRKLKVHSRAEAARLVLREAAGGEEVLRIEGPDLGAS